MAVGSVNIGYQEASFEALSDQLVVTEETIGTDVAVNAGAAVAVDVKAISKTGYKPIAVIGWRHANATGKGGVAAVTIQRIRLTSSGIQIYLKNVTSGTNATGVNVYVRVLWAKDY